MSAMFTLAWDDEGETIPHVEASHASTIRRAAGKLAEVNRRSVRVLRAGTVSYVIDPDGTRRPPNDVKVSPREQCTASDDGPPCFCTPCRAQRREGKQPGRDDVMQRLLDGR